MGWKIGILENTPDKTVRLPLEQIDIEDIHIQTQGYFGPQGIGNVYISHTDPLKVEALQNLANIRAQEIVNLHDSFGSGIIDKSIKVSIPNN